MLIANFTVHISLARCLDKVEKDHILENVGKLYLMLNVVFLLGTC